MTNNPAQDRKCHSAACRVKNLDDAERCPFSDASKRYQSGRPDSKTVHPTGVAGTRSGSNLTATCRQESEVYPRQLSRRSLRRDIVQSITLLGLHLLGYSGMCWTLLPRNTSDTSKRPIAGVRVLWRGVSRFTPVGLYAHDGEEISCCREMRRISSRCRCNDRKSSLLWRC